MSKEIKPILVVKLPIRSSHADCAQANQVLRNNLGMDYHVIAVNSAIEKDTQFQVINGETLSEEKYNELIELIKESK